MKNNVLILCFFALFLGSGCHQVQRSNKAEGELIPITKAALYDSCSVYFGDFGNYPKCNDAAPIGIFDSGTGGLTVMEAILTLDLFNNITGEEGPDGISDFAGETFIYLADQANMPYGNYSAENKTDFLRELIIQDALFLLGHKVKSMVVACNTATATGLHDIQTLLEMSRTGVSVTGVINAGVAGALELISKDESLAIGVMATVGTIQTEGYQRTIEKMSRELGYTGTIQVVNQSGMGFAEAVDEEPDFVLRSAKQPRTTYRGPALNHPDYPIDPQLLDAYHFDFKNNGMLYAGSPGAYTQLQLNAASNYARYHLLSLVEQLRASPNPQVLKVLIMGCTHYPYHKETLRMMLDELRHYSVDDHFPYRDIIAQDVVLVDPSVNTAKELYILLRDQKLFSSSGDFSPSGFYITVPNSDVEEASLESPGRFTYDYKYGRNPGVLVEDVQMVPFSPDNIGIETINRFRSAIPITFSIIPNLQ